MLRSLTSQKILKVGTCEFNRALPPPGSFRSIHFTAEIQTVMSHCPCCSNRMLRHVRNHQIHWFCRQCWQEMPDLNNVKFSNPLGLIETFSWQVKAFSVPLAYK